MEAGRQTDGEQKDMTQEMSFYKVHLVMEV